MENKCCDKCYTEHPNFPSHCTQMLMGCCHSKAPEISMVGMSTTPVKKLEFEAPETCSDCASEKPVPHAHSNIPPEAPTDESWTRSWDDEKLGHYLQQLLEMAEGKGSMEKWNENVNHIVNQVQLLVDRGHKAGKSEALQQVQEIIERYFKGLIAISNPKATKENLLAEIKKLLN